MDCGEGNGGDERERRRSHCRSVFFAVYNKKWKAETEPTTGWLVMDRQIGFFFFIFLGSI